jgi:hypothetical protein
MSSGSSGYGKGLGGRTAVPFLTCAIGLAATFTIGTFELRWVHSARQYFDLNDKENLIEKVYERASSRVDATLCFDEEREAVAVFSLHSFSRR